MDSPPSAAAALALDWLRGARLRVAAAAAAATLLGRRR